VLAVASAKALLVMIYFMHLKFEGRWKFVLLAPTIILALGLPLALLPDVGAHYYLLDVPQDREVAHETAHGAVHIAPAAHNPH
jgi:cytochrome c oxidase subunit 4